MGNCHLRRSDSNEKVRLNSGVLSLKQRDENGIETVLSPELYYRFTNPLLPRDRDSSDPGIPYRDWPYGVYVCPESATRLFDPRRLLASGVVNLLPNVPHTSTTVFDGSPGALDVPGSNSPFPSTSKGAWQKIGTQDALELPVDGIDLDTGLKRQANSDWVPPVGSILSQITGGKPVEYRRGYPDFSDWTEFTAIIDPMTGNNAKDFPLSTAQLATDRTLTIAQADAWIRNSDILSPAPDRQIVIWPYTAPKWVWHHHHDMRHMQLVPSGVNTGSTGGAPHRGGASWAERVRW